MDRPVISALIVVVFCCCAIPRDGQGTAGVMGRFLGISEALAEAKPVSLREAVRLALENNHEIRASQNALSSQGEDVGVALSNLLPKISFEERFLRTTNPSFAFMAKLNQARFTQEDFAINSLNNPSATNDFQTSFSFEQPVFVRKAGVGLDMAKTEYAAGREEYIRRQQELALKVAKTYLSVMTAKQFVRVSEKALEDSREHLRVAGVRYSDGVGLYSDSLRASTSVTEAEQRLVSAQKNLNVAKRALGLLLGRDEAIETTEGAPDIALMPVEYYMNSSLARRDIKSLELRYENAKNNVKLAEASYFPNIGIGGNYQLNDHNTPFGSEGTSWTLLAFLRWDIFDGTKRERERTKAKFQVAETEEHLKGLKKAVSFKVYDAYLGVEEAKKNAELSSSALATAEEGTRLVMARYERSLSPVVDLLDAQATLDQARANAVARSNDYLLSVINLSYEAGTILQDLKTE
ncbi:MAG TPA: TolC family protein [Thermodesulfovibrionales bacterium]|nr:TolC family protein [Thermodesulfovibrionales bacterium]